jgi:two-component system, cell cycle sensor histidine kinase and response regulator CckA
MSMKHKDGTVLTLATSVSPVHESVSHVVEAIRLTSEYDGEIHVLMTDVILPRMNGKDLACQIVSRRHEVKCLFMSGYTANVIALRSILDEGVRFIQKPFTLKDLAAKARGVLEEG